MKSVRFGIVGLGNMGGHHMGKMSEVSDADLSAMCDSDPQVLNKWAAKYPTVATFSNHQEMLASGKIDAVIIATPHYDHPRITRDAFAKNIHVITEKPVAVDVQEARLTNELFESKYSHLKYGAMFQVRTRPIFQKMRELIADGEIGEVTRLTWIATDWFRTWTYYASGGWRATWSGEGGGVLLNQCPHNLDLIQWLLGGMMPSRVIASAFIAKTHPIEVEDEISAIMEYPSGAIGHFIASTGESPGANRLEIVGDRGTLLLEHGKLIYRRNRKSVREVRETSPLSFTAVEAWDITVPIPDRPDGTQVIVQNFVNAILKGEPLMSSAVEGVKGLELGNAMLLSGLTRQPVDLPLNGKAYQAFLKDLDKKYGGKKTLGERKAAVGDLSASFTK